MKSKIRVGIVGVGNCAAALVQGVEFYQTIGKSTQSNNGLMSPKIGDYKVTDIQFVAAFDVAKGKVGRDLSEALHAPQVCTRNVADIGWCDVSVLPGPLLDGIGKSAAEIVSIDERSTSSLNDKSIVDALKLADVDVLVNFLPVGSTAATEFYANCALNAHCAFVNAIPVSIGRDKRWRDAFADAAVPLIGDDIKSQVGATIVHRALVDLFSIRGYDLDRTYQLNVGGNLDFYNMLSRERLAEKRRSKTQAILDVANRGSGMPEDDCHISPSDYVAFLKDEKVAFIRLEGKGFAGAPIDIEVRMSVADSPNSAGVVVDAIRYAKIAIDSGQGGYLEPASSWLMKAPAYNLDDHEAKLQLDNWVAASV